MTKSSNFRIDKILLGDFIIRVSPQYGTPHTSSDGVYTEGLAYAYEIAALVGDDNRKGKYLDAIALSISNLKSVQLTPEDCENYELPHRAIGGFKSTGSKVLLKVHGFASIVVNIF